jgi:hypothetical protein
MVFHLRHRQHGLGFRVGDVDAFEAEQVLQQQAARSTANLSVGRRARAGRIVQPSVRSASTTSWFL